MGSISGLKTILLLVDLCTCRKSDQNQSVELINSKGCLVLNIMSTSCRTLLPGIN